MTKLVLPLLALPMLLAVAVASRAQDAAPDLSPLPVAPGREVVGAKCGTCHPIAIVAGQKRSQVEWETTIDLMIGRGAEINDAEYAEIAAYLGTHFAP